jgi:hypothetical protein
MCTVTPEPISMAHFINPNLYVCMESFLLKRRIFGSVVFFEVDLVSKGSGLFFQKCIVYSVPSSFVYFQMCNGLYKLSESDIFS